MSGETFERTEFHERHSMFSPPPAPPPRASSLARRAAVGTVGGALSMTGVVMMVLPGPGVLMIFVGLAVLSTEFEWARRALERGRSRAVVAVNHLRTSRAARWGVVGSAAGLIVGGIFVAVTSEVSRYLGVSAVVAGILGLVVLVPAVQRFVLGSVHDAAIATDEAAVRPQ